MVYGKYSETESEREREIERERESIYCIDDGSNNRRLTPRDVSTISTRSREIERDRERSRASIV